MKFPCQQDRAVEIGRRFLASLSILAAAGCSSVTNDRQYNVVARDFDRMSPTVAYVAGRPGIPINKRYDELLPSEREAVHKDYEGLARGDEPPFPADGLKPLHEAALKAQMQRYATGRLFVLASVDVDGTVTEVKVMESPDPEMARFVASMLLMTRFKPALCAGRPCAMDFRFGYRLSVR
jgi:hypothetical protein